MASDKSFIAGSTDRPTAHSFHLRRICLSLLLLAAVSVRRVKAMSTMSSSPTSSRRRVAIVGGGISGCACLRQLVSQHKNVHVSLFDWGRSVGGRSSHRFRPEPATADPHTTLKLHYDHGAQFFHVTDDEFLGLIRPVIQQWPEDASRLGWLDSKTGTFTTASQKIVGNGKNSYGFFGACDMSLDSHRYVGIGGMNALCEELLRGAKEIADDRIQIYEGTRVARCERVAADGSNRNVWKLFGDGLGHEQANTNALQNSQQNELGEFDEIVITDHMAAAMPSWHPCHIVGLEGAVPELVSTLRTALEWNELERRFACVKPLFSCMVALERKPDAPSFRPSFDAAAIEGNGVLQWVCSQDSRPHPKGDDIPEGQLLDRWILVSTAEFAAQCLGSEGMSKLASSSSSGVTSKVEYIPQTDDYLRSDPAKLMCDEFIKLLKIDENVGNEGSDNTPKIVYSKCQRWGAAYTTKSAKMDLQQTEELMNVFKSHELDNSVSLCGDFVNVITSLDTDDESSYDGRCAIQGAAFSGMDAAKRIANRMT